MKTFMIGVSACVTLGYSLAVMAVDDAQQYCNEAYPSEYYSPEDRAIYVQECLDMYISEDEYNTDDASQDTTYEEIDPMLDELDASDNSNDELYIESDTIPEESY